MIACGLGPGLDLHRPGLEAVGALDVDRGLAGDVEDRGARHVERLSNTCPLIARAALTPGRTCAASPVDVERDVELAVGGRLEHLARRDAADRADRALRASASGEASTRISTGWPGATLARSCSASLAVTSTREVSISSASNVPPPAVSPARKSGMVVPPKTMPP